MPSYTLSYDDAQERRQALPVPQGLSTTQNLAGALPPLGMNPKGPLTKSTVNNQLPPRIDPSGNQYDNGQSLPPPFSGSGSETTKALPELGSGLKFDRPQTTVKETPKSAPTRALGGGLPQGPLNIFGENINAIKDPYTRDGVTFVPWDNEAFLAKRLLPQQQYLDYSAQQPKYDEYGDVIEDTGGVRINQALDPRLMDLERQKLGVQQAEAAIKGRTADNGRYKQYERTVEDLAGNPIKVPGGIFDSRTGQLQGFSQLSPQAEQSLVTSTQPQSNQSFNSYSKQRKKKIMDAFNSDDPRKRSIAEKYFGKL